MDVDILARRFEPIDVAFRHTDQLIALADDDKRVVIRIIAVIGGGDRGDTLPELLDPARPDGMARAFDRAREAIPGYRLDEVVEDIKIKGVGGKAVKRG